MSPLERYAKKQAKARQRRRHTAHERLRYDQQRAQRAIEALEQALYALGLPDNLVQEIEGRLRRQQNGINCPSFLSSMIISAYCFDIISFRSFSAQSIMRDRVNE